jgi:hypothetical protein
MSPSPRLAPRLCWLTLALALTTAQPGWAQFDDPRTPPRAPRAAIYFPPFPPPLDQTIARGVSAPSALSAPSELAEHAAEIYYPQLSTRLATDDLPPGLRTRLAAYRSTRSALARELESLLDTHADADAATRDQALAQLARSQDPTLTNLEDEAEHLRADLIASDRDWSDYREWWLGEKERRGFTPVEAALVVRATAHYRRDLLPEQRRLAREIAVELSMAAESPNAQAPAWVFFDPAPARLVPPADLPPEAARRLAEFQALKAALKKELFDTIAKQDGKRSIFTSPFRELAERQAPRLRELAASADAFRAALPPETLHAAVTTGGPLSPSLVGRLDALNRKRLVQQAGTSERVSALLARVRQRGLPVLVQYRFERDGLHFSVNPTRVSPRASGSVPDPEAAAEAVRAETAVIADEYGRTLAELVNEAEAIRRDIATALGTDDPRRIDTAVGQVMRSLDQRDQAAAYQLYRTAVLGRGLSPTQRRLLFDLAVERLSLPLPAGDLQPAQRSGW